MANFDEIVQPVDHDDSETAHLSTSSRSSKAMASDAAEKHKKEKHHTTDTFLQHLSTAAHASLLLFVILIIYLCFSEEWHFFTWHPFLMAAGWMFLMTEAILAISKDNLFTGTLSKFIRVRLHWIFLTVGLTLVAFGFAVVYINKNNLGKHHFKTWHAIFGLIGIICAIPAALDGILALYHGPLRNYIRPKLNKLLHFVSGIAAFGFGGLALIMSVYTNWFAKRTNADVLTFGVALLLVITAVGCTLVRPIKTTLGQLKTFF